MRIPRPLLLVCALSLLGCGQAPEDIAADVPDTKADELLEDTNVWLNAKGELEQSTRLITRAEREAQEAARLASQQAIQEGHAEFQIPGPVIDDCSDPNSLWLYDTEGNTGRRLCLHRDPANSIVGLDLSRVVYLRLSTVTIYWNGRVRSLWAGVDGGNLAHCDLVRNLCYTSPSPFVGFTAWQRITSIVSDTRLNSAWLSIY